MRAVDCNPCDAPARETALLVVDVQRDFLPGGSLAVPEGDAVVPVINRYLDQFSILGLPVVATRDWHPADHCSFDVQGGAWPVHCVAGSSGAEFAPGLRLPSSTILIAKDVTSSCDSYSGFQATDLDRQLKSLGVTRLYVGGLATDYCVLNTVLDALRRDGITPATPVADDLVAALIAFEQQDGPEYWLGFNNFYVITRYNHSPLYAMAVFQLSEEIRTAYEAARQPDL